MNRHGLVLLWLLACLPAARGWAQEPATSLAEKPLPKVFIIGDSISLGYTPRVAAMLAGKATVTRPEMNCQHTGVGLAQIEKWLGDNRFDAIHFNWGIWDTHFLMNDSMALVPTAKEIDAEKMHVRHTPEAYAENLRKLVKTLKGSSTKLIFATTTPIWKEGTTRGDNIARYNDAALKVMQDEGVAIDDLHALVLPHRAAWQGADKVHFNATGNRQLAQQVSESILQAIAEPATAAKP
jgi:acyl-CoA thioesterase-1